jgi:hypothetical protein
LFCGVGWAYHRWQTNEGHCTSGRRLQRPASRALYGSSLPAGKLYESGRAFVPFVKSDLYERLHDSLPKKDREALAETNALRRAAADAAAAANAEPESFTLPDDWSKIVVGDLVLAYDAEGEAWFEAYIVEVKGVHDLLLRWRGWPDLPNFVRTRTCIALMHPSYPINTAR